MQPEYFIACPECDLLHQRGPLPPNGIAGCTRCGALLYQSRRDSLNRTLALAASGLILWLIANLYPFLIMTSEGQTQETTLIAGAVELYHQHMAFLALLVLLTGILFPLIELAGLTYLLLPLKLGFTPWRMAGMFRVMRRLHPWGMTEVFLLGILVSIAKLGGMAPIVPGPALYAFLCLIFVVAAADVSLNPDIIWDRIKVKP